VSEDDEVDQAPSPPPKPRGWRRFVIRTLVGVAVVAVLVSAARWQVARVGDRRLKLTVSRLDAEEPGWKLEAIEAERRARAPAPEQNSAPVVLAAADLIPQDADKFHQGLRSLWLPPQNHLPDPQELKSLRQHAKSTADARATALSIRDRPSGYYAVVFPENPFHSLLPHLEKVQRVSVLLRTDAVLAALDGDPNRGIRAAHAILNVGRSIGDEPTIYSQYLRASCRTQAAHAAMQTLAWAMPTEGLAELQAALLAEADEPILLYAMRGHRAVLHHFFVGLEEGKFQIEDIYGGIDPGRHNRAQVAFYRAYRPLIPGDHAECLQLLTEAIEVAKRPWHEQRAFAALLTPRSGPPRSLGGMLTNMLMGHPKHFTDTALRSRAELLTAAVALACERFRLETDRWPRDLGEIPKSILPDVPLGPFDGEPLRYKIFRDRIAVWCFCADEHLRTSGVPDFDESDMPGFGIGARVWHPDRRGLPPPEKEKKKP
jgi:hypothetical protein